MSEQSLNVQRSAHILRRRKILIGSVATLGLLTGVGYALLSQPMLSSTAIVVLPPSVRDTSTQVVIASSNPVLERALTSGGPRMSLQALRSRVQITSPAYNVLSITAQGTTALQAEGIANAVAISYVDVLSSGALPGQVVQARVLQPATDATGAPFTPRVLIAALVGAVFGLLVGAVIALAIGRSDRRLRTRDEIADAIGLPVLASVWAGQPSDAPGWRRLLESYQPGAVDSWQLRKVLHGLGLADGRGNGASLGVLSLSEDRKALAIGPQVAAFAASCGVSTALVIGPQHDPHAVATLRMVCAAPAGLESGPGQLQVGVSDQSDRVSVPGASLTVVVGVLNANAPAVSETTRTTATVLALSAGAATAEQLAQVAASAADDGRVIAGILVADPDPTDHSTGRMPRLVRPARQRVPIRMTGAAMEIRQ